MAKEVRVRSSFGRPPPTPSLEGTAAGNSKVGQGRRGGQPDPQAHLVGDVDVHVLTEGVALGEPRGTVLDQVEGLERPKGCQQLFHL